MIRTFEVQERELDEDDPWKGILTAIMFALRATYHTTTQASSMQLVFGQDTMLNIGFKADWTYIKSRKQKIIQRSNSRENKSRIPYEYKVGDKVTFKTNSITKYGVVPKK